MLMTASTRQHNKPALAPAGRRSPAWESARYSVLRRLGPALKHDMVVNLQAVAMMAEVLGARLEKGLPPAAELQRSVGRINRLAREAVSNCLKVAGWIEPSEDEGISLREGVEECLALVRSNFGFRGIDITAEIGPVEFEVPRALLRHLLVASLIALTDQGGGPGELRVKCEAGAGMAELTLTFAPGQPEAELLPFEANYRRVDWADVQALAAVESVDLARSPDSITMRIPRMVATSPLQIAPL